MVKICKPMLQFLISLVLVVACLALPAYAQDYTDIYASRLTQLNDRLEKLADYVDTQNWVNIRTYIHGPLGEIRRDIAYLSRGLTGSAKQTAKEIGKAIADDLVKLDFAAKNFNAEQVESAYNQVRQDYDRLLQIIPKS